MDGESDQSEDKPHEGTMRSSSSPPKRPMSSGGILPSAVADDSDRNRNDITVAARLVSTEHGDVTAPSLVARRSQKNVRFRDATSSERGTASDRSQVLESKMDRVATMTGIDASVLARDRRDTVVPTENTFIADPTTGRVESLPSPPRPDDTPVTDVKLDRESDPPLEEAIDQRKTSLLAALTVPEKPRNTHTAKVHNGVNTNTIQEEGDYSSELVMKSAAIDASPRSTPRRSSLGRLLNPVQSISSRIHPVTVNYAPRPDRPDSEDEDRSPVHHRRHSSVNSPALVPQTVQVADKRPPIKIHTQRSVYAKTQESLADMFDKPTQSRNGLLVLRMIFVCIILNIGVMAMETCDGMNHGSSAPGYPYLPTEEVYKAADTFFTVIFTLEFLGRVIVQRCGKELLKDMTTWIDALALLPWYLQLVLTTAGQEFNIDDENDIGHKIGLLRLLRVLRLGHILREYESMKILMASLKVSIAPLRITIFFLFTLVMLLATAIFYAEPCYNLNTCAFTDIFNSAYFIMVTVATVGYGNQVPSTTNFFSMGIAFVAMVFGQLYLAMPLAIVGNNFQDMYEVFQQSKRRKLRRHDTTLSPFDSIKLHRKSQRLCEIHYHLLHAWRVIHLNLDKFLAKGRDIGALAGGPNENRRASGVGLVGLEGTLQGQVLRCSKIKEAIEKLLEIHTEASRLLEGFVPHKRKPSTDDAGRTSSGAETVLSQVFLRARLALAKTRFGIHGQMPMDARTMSRTHRGRMWLALEVPDSSPLATAINRGMVFFALLSVWVFFCESMPEFMDSGIETNSCRHVVEDYCGSTGFEMYDAGCFVRLANYTVDWSQPIQFSCDSPTDGDDCYANGVNFGSTASNALKCVESFTPAAVELICFRLQCLNSSITYVNMEPYWIYFEWCFGLSFSIEMVLRFYASPHRRHFFSDLYNVFDFLAVLPFLVEFLSYVMFGDKPSYAIVATSPSFFSVIRVLKTMRILKLTRHFRGTQVLAQTAKEVWRQLLIPIFFLLTMCILAAAVYFEIERGTECFVGESCMWWHKELMTPSISDGLPLGKRVLVQDTRLTIITDMLRSTWLSAATFTTVGYGDMKPRTSFGRLFTMCIAVIGTIYTSMPITLVGGKFRSLYARHAEKQSVRRGGSSTSWKTKRNLIPHGAESKENSSSEELNLPHLYKLTEEELEQVRQFQAIKRTLQNLQRHLDKFQDVLAEVVRRLPPKAAAGGPPPSSNSDVSFHVNMLRICESLDHTIEEKSNAVLDTLLQCSGLIEKLQNAPPFYEAFLPEDVNPMHRSNEFEKLVGAKLKTRLIH